jgi:hypothetical protein
MAACPSCNKPTLQLEPTGETRFVAEQVSLAGMQAKTGAKRCEVYLLSCTACAWQTEGYIDATHFTAFEQPAEV